jgi:modulator of FtsH protease
MQPELQYGAQAGQVEVARNKVLRSTYLMLALTMVPTVIGAMVGMATSAIVIQHPIISSVLVIAALFGFQYGIARNRNSGIGVVLLLGMTFMLGWWLGPMLNYALSFRNGPQLIGIAAVGTGGILLAMSTIATVTKRDFSFLGKFLFVGMMVVFLAAIANLFLGIPALALTISAAAIVVFSLFLLYDVSRIVNGGETNYIMAATGVYISLWAIFAHLLNLLLALAGNRE